MQRGQITDVVTGHGGWLRFTVHGVPGDVFVQYEADAVDRLRAVAVFVDGRGQTVEAAHLRSLPLARLEAQANATGVRRAIDSNRDHEVEPSRILRGSRGGMGDAGGMGNMGDERDRESGTLVKRKPPKLVKPSTGTYSDAFYRRVAEHYLWWADNGGRPGPGIAKDAGVPVSTVHRWIRESRRRGALPPARRGAAG